MISTIFPYSTGFQLEFRLRFGYLEILATNGSESETILRSIRAPLLMRSVLGTRIHYGACHGYRTWADSWEVRDDVFQPRRH